MSLETWWPRLHQDTRDWLIAHNGEALSDVVLQDIVRSGGPVPPGARGAGDEGPDGLHLSDAVVDRIEELANGEGPEHP